MSPFGLPGGPVNFAATLFYDGRIQFQYGKGNSELASSASPSFCGPSPIAGISPGHGAYTFETPLPSFNNTIVRLDPPFGNNSIPVAILEAPAAGSTVKDVLLVSGVAYDSASPIYRIDVLVDSIKRGFTRPTLPRADFCANQKVNGCPNVGFSVNISTAGLEPGPHTLRIRVTNSRGGLADFPAQPLTFNVDAGQASVPFGVLESPTEGAEVKGTLTVRGYVANNDLRITSVDTLIDGISYGPTQYGVRRTDICTPLNPVPVNCPSVGFQFTLNTATARPPLADGKHTIQVRVRDETGRYTLIPDTPVTFTVNNGTPATITGVITSIQPGAKLSGDVEISGYVYGTGATIRSASLIVDETYSYGTLTLNQPRPEVCANLPDVAACPNIGFTYTLDTRRLNNGPHVLTIGITTTGTSFTLPAPGTPVLSVIINNQ